LESGRVQNPGFSNFDLACFNIPAFLVTNLNSLALSVLTYPTRNWLSCDKSIILESIKSLKSNWSYTTEDVFTFLDKKGFEVSYREAAMVGLMNTRLGILA